MKQVVATTEDALRDAFIRAPESPEQWADWRAGLERLHLKGKETAVSYHREAQVWASRCYAQGFLMLWDNELVCHDTGEWKVDTLLDRAERDFGGYDLVVLWSNYPLSGIDPRHALTFYDALPGGRIGLHDAIGRFHARGVRVLAAHQPWIAEFSGGDRELEKAYVDLVAECGFDGIFLDIADGPSDTFRTGLAEQAGDDKIFQSEAPSRIDPAVCEVSSWQQMTDDSTVPGTYRLRWVDRSHLVCESRRYFHDPIRELQRGWMNGGGFVIWENVFGYWASYSGRCKSWMCLMFPAQRRFADWFVRGEWTPHIGGGSSPGVFMSQWKHKGRILWTVVNRAGHSLENELCTVPDQPGVRYVDVISGQELSVARREEGRAVLAGWLERDGLMGILAVEQIDADLSEFLAAQYARFETADWTAEAWVGEHRKTDLPHHLRPVKPTGHVDCVPEGMARLPGFSGEMTTRYRMRECGYIAGVPDERHVYDGFEKTFTHTRQTEIRNVAMDRFPVTNADFAEFLSATGYQPADQRNFLKHWERKKPPEGKETHPVVYVSLSDARAYAAWRRARLPREEEWQLAAQGVAGNEWPWGDSFDEARCNHASGGTTPVDRFPNGSSVDGIMDLCGNVWEMTESERTDGHTRYQILKGGSWFFKAGSYWLFDMGAQPADWGAKLILLCDAWDRCATIGFRCVKDLSKSRPA
jgi:formylglycine-generating enzyme required for sulfatase activity